MSLPALHPDVVTITQLAGVLLATGYGLIGALSFIPATSKGARESVPSLLSATITFTVVFGAFLAGERILEAVLIAVVARVGYEAAQVVLANNSTKNQLSLAITTVAAIIGYSAMHLPLHDVATVLPLGFLAVAALRWGTKISDKKQGQTMLTALLDIALYPLFPIWMFAAAANTANLGVLVLASYILVETFDSYALLGGKALGKTQAFPALSPRKTIEGLAIGALMLLLTVFIITLFFRPENLMIAAFLTVITALLALTGDLAASRLKRAGGVKDFPVLLKRQGGMLDMIDAWIVAGAGLALIVIWFLG